MSDFPDDELHTKPLTFMGAPYTRDLARAKAAVLGVPFDCGVHPFRIGSRQGPPAIRAQSMLVRRYSPELADLDPVARLGLVDRGDVRVTPSRITDAFARIELDAHTDSYAYDPNDKCNAATQFTHAAEEQCIVALLSYHIGVRGTTYVRGAFEKTKLLGYNIITMRELFARVCRRPRRIAREADGPSGLSLL